MKKISYKNHKWDENNCCTRCGIRRQLFTEKTRMAIEGGKDYYRYETKYSYGYIGKLLMAKIRPDCVTIIANELLNTKT